MKKIIGGKLYNTDTAKYVGEYSCNTPGNFQYFSESLYQKKTGEFFIYGEGGPMTRYSKADGDGWCSGSDIVPLSLTEAKDWVSKNLNADIYISLFGEPEE